VWIIFSHAGETEQQPQRFPLLRHLHASLPS
jgi:hypothetical protein